jgi:hypothetical protein
MIQDWLCLLRSLQRIYLLDRFRLDLHLNLLRR